MLHNRRRAKAFQCVAGLVLLIIVYALLIRDVPEAPVNPNLFYSKGDVKSGNERTDIEARKAPSSANSGTETKGRREVSDWDKALGEIASRAIDLENSLSSVNVRADVQKVFSEDDLPYLEGLLNSRALFIWTCQTIVEAICILDPDKKRAFKFTTSFLQRKEDWRAIRAEVPDVETAADTKFRSVSALGYIGSPEANAYLITLLDREKAQQLAKATKFPGNEFLNLEQSTTIVQESAAYGLLFSRDDEAFKHVEKKFENDYAKHWGQSAPMDIHLMNLGTIIGLHRFYEEKGWEEGLRLLDEEQKNRPHGHSSVSIIDKYKPRNPGISWK